MRITGSNILGEAPSWILRVSLTQPDLSKSERAKFAYDFTIQQNSNCLMGPNWCQVQLFEHAAFRCSAKFSFPIRNNLPNVKRWWALFFAVMPLESVDAMRESHRNNWWFIRVWFTFIYLFIYWQICTYLFNCCWFIASLLLLSYAQQQVFEKDVRDKLQTWRNNHWSIVFQKFLFGVSKPLFVNFTGIPRKKESYWQMSKLYDSLSCFTFCLTSVSIR
jgi:hypothetical protein